MANVELFVPVDGKGLDWPRRVANAVNAANRRLGGDGSRLDAIEARLDALEARKDYGWVDYTDTQLGTALNLPAGVVTQVTRDLTVNALNDQLRGVYAGHDFWDNATDTIRARALYDAIAISVFLKLTPGASGGVIDVQLLAGTVDVGTKSIEMTGAVGVAKGIRADFLVACRSAFLANGAKVMLTASVTTELTEFSPEFYPLSAAS